MSDLSSWAWKRWNKKDPFCSVRRNSRADQRILTCKSLQDVVLSLSVAPLISWHSVVMKPSCAINYISVWIDLLIISTLFWYIICKVLFVSNIFPLRADFQVRVSAPFSFNTCPIRTTHYLTHVHSISHCGAFELYCIIQRGASVI